LDVGRRGFIATIVLLAWPNVAGADRRPATFGVGGTAGVTASASEYFPAYFIGPLIALDAPLVDRVSLTAQARVQYYTHPEEEDFGSRGLQADALARARLDLFDRGGSGRACPFLAVGAGLAALRRSPYAASASSETIVGYLVGAAVGVDFGSTRVEVSYDHPSFTMHDDTSSPAGEISVGVMAVLGM